MEKDPKGVEAFEEFMQQDTRTKAIEQIDIDIKNLENQKRELVFRIIDEFRRINHN